MPLFVRGGTGIKARAARPNRAASYLARPSRAALTAQYALKLVTYAAQRGDTVRYRYLP